MTMEQRIEQLEQRGRFLIVCLAGLSAAGGIALFSGAAQRNEPENLRLKSLEIVDSQGNVRIVLGSVESPIKEGLYGVFLKDSTGEIRSYLQDQAQLGLSKDEGAVSLSAGGKGAGLQLSGPASRPRAIMSARDDQCEIQLRDTHGEIAWHAFTPRIRVPRNGKKEADPFAP